MTDFNLTIEMSAATVVALQNAKSVLAVYSAVEGADASALPLVWFLTANYSATTQLQWSTDYEAYVSTTPVAGGNRIATGSEAFIRPGQTFRITNGPVGTTVNGGTPGAIRFANRTTSQCTCGIEQYVADAFAPVCAYPLFGGNTLDIVPLPAVALYFTTEPLTVGEAFPGFSDASGPAILVLMNQSSSTTLGYDVNRGWSGSPNIIYPLSGGDFVAALIQTRKESS